MFGVDVAVIGRPRIVHRHATEPAEDTGVVDALAAAFGMTGDQRVLAGAGAVHPMQRAGHLQTGLVEPGHLGLGDALSDLIEEVIQSVGGAPGHRRDSAFADRGAKQLGQRPGGALLGQELPHVEVKDDRSDPRPVLHRRGHALGRGTASGGPTATAARDELVFGHPHRHRRQVEHLPPLHTPLGCVRQVGSAAGARAGLMPQPLVRVID